MIKQCIESVLAQNHTDLEYVVVDGGSTDGTLEIINQYKDRIATIISEKDNGLYDAMNKGIKAATGEVVGILNSDDIFYDNTILSKISEAFDKDEIDATIADIVFLKRGSDHKVARKYSAKKWKPARFAWGYMPPHPSFFIKRSLLSKFGLYNTDYRIGADYELLIRYLLVNKIKWKYLPIITTKMSLGGTSTQGFKSLFTINKEIAKACKENNVFSNYVMIYSKYLFKPFEFIFK